MSESEEPAIFFIGICEAENLRRTLFKLPGVLPGQAQPISGQPDNSFFIMAI